MIKKYYIADGKKIRLLLNQYIDSSDSSNQIKDSDSFIFLHQIEEIPKGDLEKFL